MKTIENLRTLQDAFLRASGDDDVRRTGSDFGAEMVAQSDRLLAVVEAAERFRDLTERDDGDLDARFNARGQLFAALRALKGNA